MDETNIENLISEMAQKSKKTEEEIQKLIDAKTEKFSGLLTKEGAAFLVQKELGLRNEETQNAKVGELREGKKGVEVKGKIETIYPVKEFEKSGKKGKLQSFILSDDSGEVRVTLWNDQIDLYKVKQGDEITLTNAIASMYNEKKQLTLGFGGKVEITKRELTQKTKIGELKSGINNANLIGKIIRKFPCKEFESGERKGKVCSFQIGDESAIIRASAWNEKAELLETFNEGDTIKIENAYTKEGRFGVELHLGYSAQITNSEEQIATIKEIMKENISEKKMNQLIKGESAIIEGKISKVLQGKLAYLICEKCGKKATKTENGTLCENCGEINGKNNAVISATIEDDTAQVQLTLFGKTALEFMEKTPEELNKELDEKSTEDIISKLNEMLIGKEIKTYGYLKTNKFSGTNEFVAREILKQ